jgi:hypothetical protein
MTHEYHALYWHFGDHGPQNVHMHPCIRHENCNHELQGEGRECDWNALASHTPVRYSERHGWVTE